MREFVTPERPSRYSATTMAEHLETTLQNLLAGRGAWDAESDCSTTATYDYSGGSVARGVGESERGGGVQPASEGSRHGDEL